MGKRLRSWNKNKYEQYINAGRGQGEGSAYTPWITIHDFSSHGIVSRIFSYKTNRVLHFMSRNELYYFYLLEWSDKVLDIREQYPLLDVNKAINIALNAGIKYPRDNISGLPYILTCDFMITTEDGLKARTIKCTSELKNKRTLEKLEIERRYWRELGIDWQIITENEISIQKAKNIEWLYTAAKLPKHLNNRICWEIMINLVENNPIQQAADLFDKLYDYPNGSGLLLVKNLLWNKQIVCEMDRIIPSYDNSRLEMRF